MSDQGIRGPLNKLLAGAGAVRLGDRLKVLIARVLELSTDHAAFRRVIPNVCLAKAGLAIGSGSKVKVLIANTITYVIDGVIYTKTTAEIDFTATTHDIAADAGSTRAARYLLSVVANGDVTVTKGTEAATVAAATTPATPAGGVPIGYVGIQIAAGATAFDATTDELDEAHITDTYVDLSYNPTDAALPATLSSTAPAAIP